MISETTGTNTNQSQQMEQGKEKSKEERAIKLEVIQAKDLQG